MGDDLEPRFRETVSQVMVRIGRELRQRPTAAEALLWEHLRGCRLDGIKIRRQHAIANTAYVVDFYCYESRLCVELDGPIHDLQLEADLTRQEDIEALGHKIIRFRNSEVIDDLEAVLMRILTVHYARLDAVIER